MGDFKMKKIMAYAVTFCLLFSCISILPVYAEDSTLPLVNGYYEIDSPEDLIAFQEMINSGEAYGTDCNAKLTADIDMTGQSWRPIEELGFLGGYSGIFDGQGHVISNLTYKTTYDASLFGTLGGAVIKNLGLVNVDMQGASAAGIALYFLNDESTTNEITNCFVTGNISGSNQVGGLVAGANNNGTNSISNSYFCGSINQSGSWDNTGGLVGRVGNYAHLTLSNCFFSGANGRSYGPSCEVDKFVVSTNIKSATEEEFASGMVAYTLNKNGESIFYQKIGTDPFPIFSGPKVYFHNVNCTECTYTNTTEPNYDHRLEKEACVLCGANFHRHIYDKNGVCVCGSVTHAHVYDENEVCECGVIYPGEDADGDGFIEIGTAEQLCKFRDSVNHSTPFKNANAILTADIVFNEGVLNADYGLNSSSFKEWEPIDNFDGIFDGQGYTIFGLYNTRGNTMDATFAVALTENGIIRNLNIADSYIAGTYTVGGLVSECKGKIENCSFDGFIYSKEGESEVGGLVGYSTGKASIINCFSLARIHATSGVVAGIVGSDINTYIENCYFAGKFVNCNASVKAYTIAQNGVKCKNCYYNSDISQGLDPFSSQGKKEIFGKTTAQFSSGELVQYLGEAYGQTIGKDATPVINGPEVFYGHKDCLSTKKDYGNEVRYEKPTDNHLSMNDNGFCGHCKRPQEGALNENGVYEIANIGQLCWLSNEVNSGNNSINAVLVADVALNSNVLTEDGMLNRGIFTLWTPIGNTSSAYNGVFDGNGHSVSGLYYSDVNGLCVGLFGCVGANGIVLNLTVSDSYLLGKNAVGAIAGYSAGAISNCVNESSVIGSAAVNAFAGLNDGTVENCTNNGWVTFDDSQGGMIGGGNSDIPNAGDKTNLWLWMLVLCISIGVGIDLCKKKARSI